MKKLLASLLAVCMILALASCGTQDTTSPTGEKDSAAGTEYDPSASVDFETKTSDENQIVTIGTIDKSLYSSPILVTSFGQSVDAGSIQNALKNNSIEHTYKPQAAADEIASYKTLIICVGASTKGLGAAGINEKDEIARAGAIMQKVKETGAQVICVHIGGATRRGATSDTLLDLVLPACSYIVLKEDANFDYKFTKYAEENNIPITLIAATKNTVQVFGDLLK